MQPHLPKTKRSQAIALVVDPNPITLLATAGTLDTVGIGCFCARNAAAAIQVPQQSPVDCLVIEVSNDAEESLALIARLRDLTQNPQLPAILIADGLWAGLERRCESLEGLRCLFKPIDPNVLIDLVHQALWMPHLIAGHRQRGASPTHLGWVQL